MPTKRYVVVAKSHEHAARRVREEKRYPREGRVEDVTDLGRSSRGQGGQSRNIEWHRFAVVVRVPRPPSRY